MAAVRIKVSNGCWQSAVAEQLHESVDSLLIVVVETVRLLVAAGVVTDQSGLTPKTTIN